MAPEWLPRLEVHGIVVGDSTVDITLCRTGDEIDVDTTPTHGLDVVRGSPPAPLWGAPVARASTSL